MFSVQKWWSWPYKLHVSESETWILKFLSQDVVSRVKWYCFITLHWLNNLARFPCKFRCLHGNTMIVFQYIKGSKFKAISMHMDFNPEYLLLKLPFVCVLHFQFLNCTLPALKNNKNKTRTLLKVHLLKSIWINVWNSNYTKCCLGYCKNALI